MAVARTTEISAAGPTVEDAVKAGVDRANKTLSGIEGVWVKDIKANANDGKIEEFRVDMKVTFVLQD